MSKQQGILIALILLFGLQVFAQQSLPSQAGAPAATAAPAPAVAPTADPVRINLDVLVTDRAGKPVGELEPFDFTLLDNNQPRKVLAFRRTDGVAGNKFDPPVEVIILLDAVNLPYQAITQQRLQVEKFLRQNGGKLLLPTSVFLLSSQGLRVQPMPSKDGNALAEILDKSSGTVRARDLSGGVYSINEQFQDSFKAFQKIAENEARKPGRKILIWIGSGWPLLTERFFMENNPARQNYFHQLVTTARQLREARIAAYNVAPIVGVTRELYKGYLKPVKDFHQMEIADLALEVFAVETGGRVLDPSNDLVELINNVQNEVGTYYTLTFAPPAAARADEYHELKVQLSQPGLTARTNTGYYNQP